MAEFNTKCPHCNAELEVQDEWLGMEVECPICKQAFAVTKTEPQPPYVVPVENPQPAANGKNCPFCKNALDYNATYCQFCRQYLPQTERFALKRFQISAVKLSKKVIIISTSIVAVICILTGAMFALGNEEDISSASDSIWTFDLSDNVKIELVKIKAGSFLMGSPSGELGRSDNETQHKVTLTKDYWLGKFEVTKAQFEAVMQYDPYYNTPIHYRKIPNAPVVFVTWAQAKNFCSKLTRMYAGKLPAGYEFSLPTEAQWEYACRADSGVSALNNCKELTTTNEKCCNLDEVGWYKKNIALYYFHEVGKKRCNAWGLYDMHGNVEEWCEDLYSDYSTASAIDPLCSSSSNPSRIIRGGSAYDNAERCRSASRRAWHPNQSHDFIGFRLALVPIR